MDWAIGQGFAGLMNTTNKRESAKEQLGMLQTLDQQMKADRAEKEQADLKEQAYQAEVSKFADTLLAPDRAKINRESKVLSSMIREHVKANGGDMTKFFANGGHKILGDYKNSLINSESASQYIDNKKNMERIVDLQMKGFGHLINQNDKFNLDMYQKNGTGKITYTGQLNEIKVPDLSNYDMGKEIPPEEILHYDQNYVKFLGNYKMTYPSAEYPPTDEQLKNFVRLSHSDLIGQNWQKDLGYKKEAFDQSANIRDFDYKKEQDVKDRDQWWTEFKAGRDDEEFRQRMEMRKLELEEAEAAGKLAKTTDAEKSEKIQSEEDFITDTSEMISSVGYDVKDITQLNSNTFNRYATIFGLPVLQDYLKGSEDYSDSGGGGILKQGGIKDALTPSYVPRSAKLVINGQNATTAAREAKFFNVDENGVINGLDLTQHTDLIDAAGVKVSNWEKGVDSKGLITKNYAEDVADRKFKVKGIITGAFGKDAKGREIMIMNRVKGLGQNTKVDVNATKEYEKRIGKEVTGAGMFMIVESEKGDTFYKPIRESTQLAQLAKWGGVDTKNAKRAMQEGHNKATATNNKNIASKKAVLGAVDEANRNPTLVRSLMQDARMIPGAGTAGSKHTPLVLSFYANLKAKALAQGVDAGVADFQSQGEFNNMMAKVNSNPQHKKGLESLINTPNTDERKIIDYLKSIGAISEQSANSWKETHLMIKNRK